VQFRAAIYWTHQLFQSDVSLPIFDIFSTHCSGVTFPLTTTFLSANEMSYDCTPEQMSQIARGAGCVGTSSLSMKRT
jgi:hypothetical protein